MGRGSGRGRSRQGERRDERAREGEPAVGRKQKHEFLQRKWVPPATTNDLRGPLRGFTIRNAVATGNRFGAHRYDSGVTQPSEPTTSTAARPRPARRAPADLPFRFADRELVESLAAERQDPAWLL